jgi:hypothetical protein
MSTRRSHPTPPSTPRAVPTPLATARALAAASAGAGGAVVDAEGIKLGPITYIEGTVKGFVQHRFHSRLVAFLGKNRRGKTAALDTIRISMTGKHPVGKHGTSFYELAPEGCEEFYALARGPNLESRFAVPLNKKGEPSLPPTKPTRGLDLLKIEGLPDAETLFARMLPMQSWGKLVTLGSTLGREEIFRRFGQIDTVPVPMGLSDEQRALWAKGHDAVVAELARRKRKDPETLDDAAAVLTDMSRWFRTETLSLGRQIRAAKERIEKHRAEILPAVAGAEELPKLREELKKADAWERSAGLRTRKAQIEKEIEAYRAAVRPLNAEEEKRAELEAALDREDAAKVAAIAELKTQLTALDAELAENAFRLGGGLWYIRELKVREEAGKAAGTGIAPCFVCSSPFKPRAVLARDEPTVKKRQKETDALVAKKTAVTRAIDDASGQLEVFREERRRRALALERQKNDLKVAFGRLESARDENAAALAGVPDSYAGPTAVELRGQIKALEDAVAAQAALEAESAALKKLELDHFHMSTLEEETTGELARLLRRTSEAANAAVNRYITPGVVSLLNLDKAQWMVVGADGRPHSKKVISGLECGSLIPALACAWTEGAPGRFVLLDDEDLAGFDPENLALLLDALKRAVEADLLTQVFIAWSRPDEIPNDWGQKILIEGPPPDAFAPPLALAPSL